MQELLYHAPEGGRAFGPMSKFRHRGKMATKLAMACLPHMVLSPVVLRQIGNECQHMAPAALSLHVKVCCLHHLSSMSCDFSLITQPLILFLLFAFPYFTIASCVNLFFSF